MQINITTIENGYLVATPPSLSQQQIIQLAQQGQQPGPTVNYCEDVKAVVKLIERFLN